jgi:hypothetical protein
MTSNTNDVIVEIGNDSPLEVVILDIYDEEQFISPFPDAKEPAFAELEEHFIPPTVDLS